jgi:hypothetical protein
MGRNIAIVGAGQAGLQLSLGLLSNHCNVTLVTELSAQQILEGKIFSSQAMFNEALQFEREIGIDFWQKEAPQNTSVTFTIAKPHATEIGIRWQGLLDKPFQSVDQRLKFSRWLNEVTKRGGHVVAQKVTMQTLSELTDAHDLTIVASGKGALSKIFKRNESHSPHISPPRTLSCFYVKGMKPIAVNPGVRPTIIPGVGEYFTLPGLTQHGACEMMLFEGVPGGPFDCWKDSRSPTQHMEKAIELLKQFIPWEAERCANIELLDENSTLIGSYTPEVRHPVYTLDSGKSVLGMADAVVLNDPIAGQGANNASKCAKIYMDRILSNEENTFSSEWMKCTFDHFWEDAQWSTALSNLLLLPPEEHIIQLLTAASKLPKLAGLIANGFDCPRKLFPWMSSSEETRNMIMNFERLN